MLPHWIFSVALAVFVGIAAVTDLRMHRIPNYLTAPVAALGIVFRFAVPGIEGQPLIAWLQRHPHADALAWSVLGFGLGFSLLFIPWALGGGGAGDIKLLAALGAWLGPWWIFVTFAVAMLCASAMAIAVWCRNAVQYGALKRRREHRRASPGESAEKNRRRAAKRTISLAVPIALATWIVLGCLVLNGTLVLVAR
jgi:prepilin peptidase CpaA